jgi:CDP-glucose 4,6-dehydratase
MFNNVFYNKKIIVTGHTGFKGAWLTTWLLKLNAKVIGISNDIPTVPSLFENLNLEDKIKHYKQDIRDLDKIRHIFLSEKPDFLFHLAAQPIVSTSYENPIETFSTNVMGTAHILESLRALDNDCTAIIITSDKCYDNVEWVWGYKETDGLGGRDIYSGSKGAAELVFRSYYYSFFKNSKNIRLASARAGNVIGGGDWAKDRIVPDCMKAWSNHQAVEIRSPNATRPWQHVLEPLSGYLNLAQELYEGKNLHGESFNFGPKSEHNHSVEKLLQDLSYHWNFEQESDAYVVTDNIKFHEAGLLKLNCDKALFHLKWLPVLEYDQLINFTGSWYFNYYKQSLNMWELTLTQIQDYENRATEKRLKWSIK